jgi:hypothetical protein
MVVCSAVTFPVYGKRELLSRTKNGDFGNNPGGPSAPAGLLASLSRNPISFRNPADTPTFRQSFDR